MNALIFLLLCLSAFGELTRFGVAAELLSTGDEVKQFVARNIHENNVMIFAKSYCPYCKMTKQTFRALISNLETDSSLKYKVIELDELPGNDGPSIQHELYEITGQRTVPNVFIGGEHVGGNSDVQSLFQEERLHDMVMQSSTMSDL